MCTDVSCFEREFMDRGPKDIHAHLTGDHHPVRLQGVLTAAEKHPVQSLPVTNGRDLLKQVRTQMIEAARPVMEAMAHEVTGVKASSLHHDNSTFTGEESVVFTLAESPLFSRSKQELVLPWAPRLWYRTARVRQQSPPLRSCGKAAPHLSRRPDRWTLPRTPSGASDHALCHDLFAGIPHIRLVRPVDRARQQPV